MANDDTFLYLTTVGRSSGRARGIEIWFVERAGRFYMISERRERSNWVQNIARESRVRFSVGQREDRGAVMSERGAVARVVPDGAEPGLEAEVRGLMQQKYGWSVGLIVELRVV